jgi:surface antigen
MSKVLATKILAIARAEIGYKESPPSSNRTKFGKWYGMDGEPWCDMFVSWVASQSGAADIIGKFAYTPDHAEWFQNRGQWGSKPKIGAIVFYDFGAGRIRHVGIVSHINADGTIVAIEGNTSPTSDADGGMVMERKRAPSLIAGYGYPAYADIEPEVPLFTVRIGGAPHWVLTQTLYRVNAARAAAKKGTIPAGKVRFTGLAWQTMHLGPYGEDYAERLADQARAVRPKWGAGKITVVPA